MLSARVHSGLESENVRIATVKSLLFFKIPEIRVKLDVLRFIRPIYKRISGGRQQYRDTEMRPRDVTSE